jgi:hypothetical protein
MPDRPIAPFGTDASDDDEVRERHVVLRTVKRLRSLIVLVPLAAVVLVAAGIGASKLWAEIPVREDPDPPVTCWDGTETTLSECSEPTGLRGLRWVFPSFRPSDDACERVRRSERNQERPLEVACTSSFDQRPVTLTYSVRTSLDQGLTFLERRYGEPPTEDADGERLVFRSQGADEDGLHSATVAYADHPFAVTVEAPDPDVRDDALAELVRYRPADEVVARG